jgi:hypothetical protein
VSVVSVSKTGARMTEVTQMGVSTQNVAEPGISTRAVFCFSPLATDNCPRQ